MPRGRRGLFPLVKGRFDVPGQTGTASYRTRFNMNSSDTREKSGEYLRLALNHMNRHGVPFTPDNYAVWYAYVSGRSAGLNAVIDRAEQRSARLGGKLHRCLYRRFVEGGERHASRKMLKETVEIIAALAGEIRSSGGEMVSRGSAPAASSSRTKARSASRMRQCMFQAAVGLSAVQ